MALNSRLLKIATMVREGDRVADIGTDHAYLPVYLIRNGLSNKVFACDVADGPLLNARKNIERTQTANIILRKGDGLAAVEPNEADTFVLAGMGGDLIVKLLEKASWIRDERYELLLQPMTSVEDLRKYLCDNGFAIKCEQAVKSQGRVYTVIKAVFCGEKISCEPFFYYLGKLTDNIGEDEIAYIKRKRRLVCELAENLKNVKNEEERREILIKVVADIDRLLEKHGN